ncbi:hypothetical protein [Kingella kingae]|uniref:hypothetical protein n=1 Tax=Kingella kingae TaxID=504 RepID=UPI00056F5554|nr:hypothetical protein [Kingella kingae]MDK4535653.1 hypothetical protein [Kingella kingae]MDK4539221.1 hypothetical protein [Kingella kingae]MDK4546411.1 hypothetical protein [Kingella kingae]MDK4622180.1 hypothetical protein [Kingella kingae]
MLDLLTGIGELLSSLYDAIQQMRQEWRTKKRISAVWLILFVLIVALLLLLAVLGILVMQSR